MEIVTTNIKGQNPILQIENLCMIFPEENVYSLQNLGPISTTSLELISAPVGAVTILSPVI